MATITRSELLEQIVQTVYECAPELEGKFREIENDAD